MGTPDVAILSGLKLYQEASINSGDKQNTLRKTTKTLQEIIDGLGKSSRDNDIAYYRRNITGILLGKVIQEDKSIFPSSCNFENEFMHIISSVPKFDWNETFSLLWELALIPEFVEYLVVMESIVQNHIMTTFDTWIRHSLSMEVLHIFDCLVCLAVLNISFIFLSPIHQQTSGAPESVDENTKTIQALCKLISETNTPFEGSKANITVCENLLNKTEQLIEQNTLSSRKHTTTDVEVDVLHLNEIIQSLPKNLVHNLSADDLTRDSPAILKNLSVSIRHVACPEKTLPAFMKERFTVLLDCINALDSKDHIGKDTKQVNLMSLLKSLIKEVKNLSSHDRLDEVSKNDISFENQTEMTLKIIRYHLHGYEEETKKLLRQIGQNPHQCDEWGDAITCLQNTPECLARTDIILQVMNTLESIDAFADCKSNTIPLILAMRKLFFIGFQLLPLKAKMHVVMEILEDPKKLDLISRYPTIATNSKERDVFHVTENLRLNSFFNSLISKTVADDKILGTVTDFLISSPEETVKRLIDQAIKNEPQIKLFVNIIRKIDCLDKIQVSDDLLFWRHFHSALSKSLRNNESKFIGNGLILLSKLLEECDCKLIGIFMRQLFFKSIMPSFCQVQTKQENSEIFTEDLSLKMLLVIMKTSTFIPTIGIESVACLAVCLGVSVDKSVYFTDRCLNEIECHTTMVECLEFLVPLISDHVKSALEEHTALLEWIIQVISDFTWVTQLRFLSICELATNYRIEVPGCLSEICKTPEVFNCSEELSYGPGTGLVAWHQIFAISPSLCPLSNLDIEGLTGDEIHLFTDGWTITLAQVLPHCLLSEWQKLLEASKILIYDMKLFIPLQTVHINVLPVIDLNECCIVLGLIQLLSRASTLLQDKCCSCWMSSSTWSHFTKCYCVVVSGLVNDSAEFDRAGIDSKLFMIFQLFSYSCDFMGLLDSLSQSNIHKSNADSVFILLLDLLSSMEKIWLKEIEASEVVLDADPDSITRTIFDVKKTVLELNEHLQSMIKIVKIISDEKQGSTLAMKLNNILQLLV